MIIIDVVPNEPHCRSYATPKPLISNRIFARLKAMGCLLWFIVWCIVGVGRRTNHGMGGVLV
jgi:hypothetical protein